MDLSEDIRENADSHRLRAGIFAAVALLIATDLVTDYREGVGWLHVIAEFTVFALALAGAVMAWRRFRAMRAERRRMRADLERLRHEAEDWRRRNETLVRGLARAIESQFVDWQLSRAESEVAMLLLKGLSLQEIAGTRQTSERTAREQARAVYRKSGLSGRAALSAWFLEDLLPGGGDRAGADTGDG